MKDTTLQALYDAWQLLEKTRSGNASELPMFVWRTLMHAADYIENQITERMKAA